MFIFEFLLLPVPPLMRRTATVNMFLFFLWAVVTLLRKEYSLLREGRPDQVAGLEISTQELIRQLVREREFLIRRLGMEGFSRLAEYLDGLPGEARQAADTWVERIVLHEQESARQASVNAELAMALWEQSGQLLSQFQKRVAPAERNTYGSGP